MGVAQAVQRIGSLGKREIEESVLDWGQETSGPVLSQTFRQSHLFSVLHSKSQLSPSSFTVRPSTAEDSEVHQTLSLLRQSNISG